MSSFLLDQHLGAGGLLGWGRRDFMRTYKTVFKSGCTILYFCSSVGDFLSLCLLVSTCFFHFLICMSAFHSKRYVAASCVCVCSVAQLCLFCNHMDCSPQGSYVHGIIQARILEWAAISSSRGSSPPRDQTHVSYGSYIGRNILYHWATWEDPCGILLWL